ncbi:hypothetical protein HMI55_004742 [Coelomomyces lativittatus]|nr:hypothetical protein HMI55_004742 [Coelomomyces lativittatus]
MAKRSSSVALEAKESFKNSKIVPEPSTISSTSHIANNTTFPETFPKWNSEFEASHYKILSWNVGSLAACIKKGVINGFLISFTDASHYKKKMFPFSFDPYSHS